MPKHTTFSREAMSPPQGLMPVVQYCLVDQLEVDHTYQRSIENNESQALIAGIALHWHWGRPTLGWMDADVMDPPYLFDNRGGGAFRSTRPGSNQIVEEGLDQGFNHRIINPLLCGAAVVFCHNDQLPQLLPFMAGSFNRFALLVWEKPNPIPMRNKHYLPDTEPFIHAWSPGYHPLGDHHDMHRVIKANSVKTSTFGHPTVKPEAVMDKIVRNVAGSTICDPFMGTGSTGVAAVKAGKAFVGIEQNPNHFETACQRIAAALEGTAQ